MRICEGCESIYRGNLWKMSAYSVTVNVVKEILTSQVLLTNQKNVSNDLVLVNKPSPIVWIGFDHMIWSHPINIWTI